MAKPNRKTQLPLPVASSNARYLDPPLKNRKTSSGSILEFYRQLLAELGIETTGSSRAVMTRLIKREVQQLVQGKKFEVLLIIDEASLMRLEVFSELHTIAQFDKDSKVLVTHHPGRPEQPDR